jgi:hypothetical protein
MNSKANSEENEFKAEEILDPRSEALKKVESLTAELKAVRDELKITKEKTVVLLEQINSAVLKQRKSSLVEK